ncbi:MAG TPA: inositol monophosphatase [Candidatus Dormibacteraeota bacterium]|nr:inositol monophosphatase [Candidatus Dormibacteraeota bacterium]
MTKQIKGKYDSELAFAVDLARDAGKIMQRYFRAEDIGTEWKEDNTPLTVADTRINDLVIEKVKKAFPTYGVIGEEASFEKERNLVWVVDPIDGTKPFSLGMPVSTFLLALVDRTDGQPLVGVVYDPYLDHMYTATKGGGAYLNTKRLKTSKATSFFKGYTTVYGSSALAKANAINYRPGKVVEKLHANGASVLNLSSGGYTGAKIASGEFLALVEATGKPWDSAALCVLVQEAGGLVTDLEGKQRRFDEIGLGCVLAANQTLLVEMLDMIRGSHENYRH